MITPRFVLAATIALLPMAAQAAHTHVPTPSTWVLDLKQTDFGGGPSVRADTDRVLVDNDQQLHWEDVTIDDRGNTAKTGWSGPEDGTFRPIQGFPGAKANWNTAKDSERIVFPDGSTYDAIMTLSTDQKTMTLTQTVKDAQHHTFHQKIVYIRTN